LASIVGRAFRGGFWLTLSTVVGQLTGFIFWLLVSPIVGVEALGIASAVASLAGLVSGLVSLGIGAGVSRFVGLCMSSHDYSCASRYFSSAFAFSAAVYTSASAVLVALPKLAPGFAGFTQEMAFFSALFVLASLTGVTEALLSALIRTEPVFYARLLGNTVKVVLGVALALAGVGWRGVVAAYLASSWLVLLFELLYTYRFINLGEAGLRYVSELLKAGLTSWLPGAVVLLGQALGVLTVFAVSGDAETGLYYVASMIAGLVQALATSVSGLMLPILSSMRDGRKRAASEALRVSLAISMPAAAFVAFYPWLPLSLLGSRYVEASPMLVALLAGTPLLIAYSVEVSLLYAYGRYVDVLLAGFAQSIPRLILYQILVDRFGGLGAAAAYTAGSATGFIASSLLSRMQGFREDWNKIFAAVAVPVVLLLPAKIFNLHWAAGLVLAFASLPLYTRLGILGRRELKEIAYAFLSKESAEKIYRALKPFVDFVAPS